jgi:hypothetical protein
MNAAQKTMEILKFNLISAGQLHRQIRRHSIGSQAQYRSKDMGAAMRGFWEVNHKLFTF